MSLFVECKSDETLASALGVARRDIEHALGRANVCAQLSRRNGVVGMVDEDPGSAPQPYLKRLSEQSWEHEVRALMDKERNNRVIVLSPHLEGSLVRSAKDAGLRMTDFGFDSDNGVQLHAEINQRLSNLERLVKELLQSKSPRLLRLKSLLEGKNG
jgi:hypothetical protein